MRILVKKEFLTSDIVNRTDDILPITFRLINKANENISTQVVLFVILICKVIQDKQYKHKRP
jgi:hypothetical protein